MTSITFIDEHNVSKTVDATNGLTLMEVAVEHDIPIEAICGGSLACATCHLIVIKGFEKTGNPSDDEIDMLDFADNVTPQSRLSCQITVSDNLDGIVLQVPPKP
jgi:2Fe-2S ferredoxin